MTFEEGMAAWLPGQRWFAGKGSPIDGVAIACETVLMDADPGLRHVIIAVSQGDGMDRYQVLAGLRSVIPDELTHAVIGPAGNGMTAYDGLHDPQLTRRLLEAMAGQETMGPLRFALEPETMIDISLDSLVLTGEQSNTSVLFGEDGILKVFRRPSPGPNPDLEVPRALARFGSRHVAPPLGWVETTMDGKPTVLAILSTYLRSAADGWSLAATSVRDLYASESVLASQAGGDFAAEAHLLGEATAEVHRHLAEALGIDELPAQAHRELATQMRERLDTAAAAVPALVPHLPRLRAAYAELATLDGPLMIQRIHGDYHLGQVVRTQTGWVLLDFEGEPAAPLALRRARSPALRDVAGMLRSFDYAGRQQLPAPGDPARARAAAADWVCRNQAAFCSGYAQAGGADPGKHAVLLRALTIDKAVYEVMYEARHRPSWLPIPLGFIADA
jgi:maltokinase